MYLILSRFKALGAAVVLTLGLGVVAMAPAVAQDAPPSGFSLGIPENGAALPFGSEPPPNNPEMGSENNSSRRGGNFDGGYYHDDDRYYSCLDDRAIINGLRGAGFERVRIVRYLRGERVEATAYWGRSQYSMRIDRCTGIVDRVRLIRRSGFGLQFDFSN